MSANPNRPMIPIPHWLSRWKATRDSRLGADSPLLVARLELGAVAEQIPKEVGGLLKRWQPGRRLIGAADKTRISLFR